LLSALLDISRLDISELQPQRQAVALQPLLDAAALNHQRSADAKQLNLTVHRTSIWVETDPHYLARIVSNLIGNAVRYTRNGRVLVGVRHQEGRMARIEVWDTGIGIAEEHLPSLFQEFYQVHNPERDANKGLGLGLSIVERLTRALGHTITVRSWPGRGTVFSVLLPIANPAVTEANVESAESDPSPELLLVAPDGDGDAGQLLQTWGYAVHAVSDAEALTQALSATKPSVVICDESRCSLLFAQLRELGQTHLPVLVMGAIEEDDAGTDVYVAGNLSKPLKPARLRALLLHLLEE
jgi:two-component sensor histidine kinase/CheY-like chemotaxis protein